MSPKVPRPETLEGTTIKVETGLGKLYVTINEIDGKPVEVFATIGKSGGSIMAKAEVTGRLTSLALRYGIPVQDIVDELVDIAGGQPLMVKDQMIKSIPDAVGKLLRKRYLMPKINEQDLPDLALQTKTETELLDV